MGGNFYSIARMPLKKNHPTYPFSSNSKIFSGRFLGYPLLYFLSYLCTELYTIINYLLFFCLYSGVKHQYKMSKYFIFFIVFLFTAFQGSFQEAQNEFRLNIFDFVINNLSFGDTFLA